MSNQKLALYLCLVGLASVLAASAAPADVSVPATTPETAPTAAVTDVAVTEDENGLALQDDGDDDEYYDDDYAEDYEEYLEAEASEEEEESPEEELSELAEEHYMVKQDCRAIQDAIKQAGTTPVDPDLQAAYDECMKDLDEIETDMAELTAEMEADDADVAAKE